MAAIYVARSIKLGKWASDVGLSKHIYKFGCADEDPKALVTRGWAGEDDWQLVKSVAVEAGDEAQLIESIARREKPIDPRYYLRIRETAGLFKVDPAHVENHILVARAGRRSRTRRAQAEAGRFRRLSHRYRTTLST